MPCPTLATGAHQAHGQPHGRPCPTLSMTQREGRRVPTRKLEEELALRACPAGLGAVPSVSSRGGRSPVNPSPPEAAGTPPTSEAADSWEA